MKNQLWRNDYDEKYSQVKPVRGSEDVAVYAGRVGDAQEEAVKYANQKEEERRAAA